MPPNTGVVHPGVTAVRIPDLWIDGIAEAIKAFKRLLRLIRRILGR